MASRKPISINLRDLQRVLNEGKPELPRYSSGVFDDNDESGEPTTYRAPKTRTGSSRWFNEDDEDNRDMNGTRMEREEPPEPDFSTVRTTGNEFNRLNSGNQSGRGNTEDSAERKSADDDVWRSGKTTATSEPSPEDDVWRRPEGNKGKDKTDSIQAEITRRGDAFEKDPDEDMCRRETTQSEAPTKKLYVPPTRRNDVDDSSGNTRGNRFSCLEESYERRNSNSSTHDSSRAREVFSMQRREPESQREHQGARDLFGSSNRDTTRNVHFQEQQKPGLFVPSYKRAQTAPSNTTQLPSTMHDVFMKAAGITEKEDKKQQPESTPTKSAPSQLELQLKQKTEAIIRHNRMYGFNESTLNDMEKAILSLLSGEEVDTSEIVPEDEEELVPAAYTCLIVCKACEACLTMDEVRYNFSKVGPFLKELCERAVNPIEEMLLTEIAKFMCQWKLPALSDSVHLIEAVFDALLQCGVVTRKSILAWFENSADEVPDRINVILQLLPWKKWLLGESMQLPQDVSDQESEESEEDIDIDTLAPKPIRLSKTMMY